MKCHTVILIYLALLVTPCSAQEQIKTPRGSLRFSVGLLSGISTTMTYRAFIPIGFDVGIGAFSPFSPIVNFRLGINAYFGTVWEQDAILSLHFTQAKFSGFNQWQSFSLGIGNNSSSGFYWRVGGHSDGCLKWR